MGGGATSEPTTAEDENLAATHAVQLGARAGEFFGIPIEHVDGTDFVAVDSVFARVVTEMRQHGLPAIVVLHVERLSDHTSADDESSYRGLYDIVAGRALADPIRLLEDRLLRDGVSEKTLRTIREQVAVNVGQVFNLPGHSTHRQVENLPHTVATKSPLPAAMATRTEYLGTASLPRLTMREALNETLRHRLRTDAQVILIGEDIEDPKGDVFGVTRGLSTEFPGRVLNSALSESTIVGTSIGRALAGQRPVAFIQFADFLPLACNQIMSELASMFWRTNGGWQCPVIVFATCGAYKPGLGPFHAQSFEAIAAHTPGIDVVLPSSASDAAGLLNAAFESGRPTLFLYPKSCLNLTDRTTSADVAQQFVPLGKARRLNRSPVVPRQDFRTSRDTDCAINPQPPTHVDRTLGISVAERPSYDERDAVLALVTWGNTVAQCEIAANALADHGYAIELFDLRSLSPWDESAVIASAERTGRLVVVHEDNHTCGFGAEVVATVAEQAKRHVIVRRVTRPDTFIPCHFESQLAVLPSFKRVLETCAELLGLEVTWERPVTDEATDTQPVRAIGSGPADETVDVVGLLVQVGDTVTVGQLIAEVEATKSVVEVASTVAGVVTEVCVTLGQTIPVGGVLLRIRTADATTEPSRPLTREDAGTPRLLERSRLQSSPHAPREECRMSRDADRAINPQSTFDINRALGIPHAEREGYVGLIGIASASGSRDITNDELLSLAKFPTQHSSDDILKKTGIDLRPWVDPTKGETVFTLAVMAAQRLLDQHALSIHDINLVIVSTTTPDQVTPSLACRVAAALSDVARASSPCLKQLTLPAYDINAACSGYLYALAQAFDFLQHEPTARVLVITSEVLSPLLDLTDFDTAPLFADAATATLLVGPSWLTLPASETTSSDAGSVRHVLQLHRPVLSGHPEDGSRLSVPLCGSGSIQMRGQTVFTEAVRAMSETLATACARAGLSIDDLDQIIPHQANQRILDAVAKRTAAPVFSNIRNRGNSSSSTIPLALTELLETSPGQCFGLAAFGGGFTFGAAIITRPHQQKGEPEGVSPRTDFVRDVSGA